MRPQRFEEFAVQLAKASPDAGGVMTLKEAGDSKHPYGIAARIDGREARFQVIAQSADGDRFDEPETPVEGEPVSPEAVPPGSTGPERWLAALLAGSRSREISGIEVWSARRDNREGHNGVTLTFHSGAKIFARQL